MYTLLAASTEGADRCSGFSGIAVIVAGLKIDTIETEQFGDGNQLIAFFDQLRNNHLYCVGCGVHRIMHQNNRTALDLIQRYQEERASLNAEIDSVLADITAILGGGQE